MLVTCTIQSSEENVTCRIVEGNCCRSQLQMGRPTRWERHRPLAMLHWTSCLSLHMLLLALFTSLHSTPVQWWNKWTRCNCTG